ncbi:MAG: EF-P beta-lysylation protein EpmB [Planctomycetota bacterium]
MAGAIRSSEELLRRLRILTSDEPFGEIVRRFGLLAQDAEQILRFPVLVPESFLARMKPGDIHDPLLRQVLPVSSEGITVDGFVPDAVGDLNAKRAPGVLQKYHGRVLLIATSTCAIHCRYCFRREYPYKTEPRTLEGWKPSIDEIARDPGITEVIFSGGDPWMLNDQRLSMLCREIDSIPHIERIRFHTRLPIVLPSRVTDDLLEMMNTLRSQAIVVVHANHPREIADDCEPALRRLVKSGRPVLNQTVLLRGINDDADLLEQLSRRLTAVGVMPYYLHQLDRVAGASHFEVSPDEGRRLVAELSARLPGYAVPRYVQEIAGHAGKTPILLSNSEAW